jgi:hypothetical protein
MLALLSGESFGTPWEAFWLTRNYFQDSGTVHGLTLVQLGLYSIYCIAGHCDTHILSFLPPPGGQAL